MRTRVDGGRRGTRGRKIVPRRFTAVLGQRRWRQDGRSSMALAGLELAGLELAGLELAGRELAGRELAGLALLIPDFLRPIRTAAASEGTTGMGPGVTSIGSGAPRLIGRPCMAGP